MLFRSARQVWDYFHPQPEAEAWQRDQPGLQAEFGDGSMPLEAPSEAVVMTSQAGQPANDVPAAGRSPRGNADGQASDLELAL